ACARWSGGAHRGHQCQIAPLPSAGLVERGLRARDAGADVNLPVPVIMNQASHTQIGSQIMTLFAAGMLVFQLLLVVQRMLLSNIRLFALQSLLLAGKAAIVGYFNHA